MTGDRHTASGRRLRRGELAVFAGRMVLERDRESGAGRAAAVLAEERAVETLPWPELQELLVPLADRLLERSASLRYQDPPSPGPPRGPRGLAARRQAAVRGSGRDAGAGAVVLRAARGPA